MEKITAQLDINRGKSLISLINKHMDVSKMRHANTERRYGVCQATVCK